MDKEIVNHYTVLGLNNFTVLVPEALKAQASNRLKAVPKGAQDNDVQLKAIRVAYHVLSDEVRRTAYDDELRDVLARKTEGKKDGVGGFLGGVGQRFLSEVQKKGEAVVKDVGKSLQEKVAVAEKVVKGSDVNVKNPVVLSDVTETFLSEMCEQGEIVISNIHGLLRESLLNADDGVLIITNRRIVFYGFGVLATSRVLDYSGLTWIDYEFDSVQSVSAIVFKVKDGRSLKFSVKIYFDKVRDKYQNINARQFVAYGQARLRNDRKEIARLEAIARKPFSEVRLSKSVAMPQAEGRSLGETNLPSWLAYMSISVAIVLFIMVVFKWLSNIKLFQLVFG